MGIANSRSIIESDLRQSLSPLTTSGGRGFLRCD